MLKLCSGISLSLKLEALFLRLVFESRIWIAYLQTSLSRTLLSLLKICSCYSSCKVHAPSLFLRVRKAPPAATKPYNCLKICQIKKIKSIVFGHRKLPIRTSYIADAIQMRLQEYN